MHALFFIALGIVGQAVSEQGEYDVDGVLEGLGPFRVVVEPLEEDAPVTTARLQTDVELRLRSLGIAPLAKSNRFLYVDVRRLPVNAPTQKTTRLYGFSIRVSYIDFAELSSGMRAHVSAWNTNSLAFAVPDAAEEHIRKILKDKVDVFANAWLKTHPVNRRERTP